MPRFDTTTPYATMLQAPGNYKVVDFFAKLLLEDDHQNCEIAKAILGRISTCFISCGVLTYTDFLNLSLVEAHTMLTIADVENLAALPSSAKADRWLKILENYRMAPFLILEVSTPAANPTRQPSSTSGSGCGSSSSSDGKKQRQTLGDMLRRANTFGSIYQFFIQRGLYANILMHDASFKNEVYTLGKTGAENIASIVFNATLVKFKSVSVDKLYTTEVVRAIKHVGIRWPRRGTQKGSQRDIAATLQRRFESGRRPDQPSVRAAISNHIGRVVLRRTCDTLAWPCDTLAWPCDTLVTRMVL